MISIVWFRLDLRLSDNPALAIAAAMSDTVVPVFIHAPTEESPWPSGAAARWWLHFNLHALDADLRNLGSKLVIRSGSTIDTLWTIIKETKAKNVFWNRRYEPAIASLDSQLMKILEANGIRVHIFNGSLLFDPETILNKTGLPFRIFSAYWKSCQQRGIDIQPYEKPKSLKTIPTSSLSVSELSLLSSHSWHKRFTPLWSPSESGAQQVCNLFVQSKLSQYADERNILFGDTTSQLSPHLHFGTISPRQVLATIHQYYPEFKMLSYTNHSIDSYIRELGWREFAYYLLCHYPHTPCQPFNPKFSNFHITPFNSNHFIAWTKGLTGIPIIDAAMRALWTTGWMHNRARMLTASFLTKNLGIPWLKGAHWFWDTLVDADLANNTLGWQWTAGCGVDAAPYFRIFNPVLQGERFDPEGHYIRQWLPELSRLPTHYIHKPWLISHTIQSKSGIVLGKDYPFPLVDLTATRNRALEAYAKMKHHQK